MEQETLICDYVFSQKSYEKEKFDDDNEYEPIDKKVGDDLKT